MNLRIRDNAIYWVHRALAAAGNIRAEPLSEIRKSGFQRVLIVATTAIGDAVLCTPLIDSLRRARPGVKIGFWVGSAAVPLFKEHSGLDEVISYHGKYRRIRETMECLKQGQYDLALVSNANDPDVIPMIWWSGCRRILRRPQRHTIYSFMIGNPDMLSRSHTSGHAIERNLQFCDLLKIPRGEARTRLEVNADARRRIDAEMQDRAFPWWIIHPGASRSKKQWGTAHYAELASRILESQDGVLILTGSAPEKEACDEIQSRICGGKRIINLAGKLGLDDLAALFSRAQLLISGDTGPFHIAMAVGTATVTLFAPWDTGSSPEINGPSFELARHPIVQTQRMGDPISTLSVDQVFGACRPFWQKERVPK